MKLSKNFDSEEFKCSCCGEVHMDTHFIHILQGIREAIAKPMTITSGYRCEVHNANVGGKPNSAHTKGLAVDIACADSSFRYKLIETCMLYGINRIGISGDFIHVDYDHTKPDYVVWTY